MKSGNEENPSRKLQDPSDYNGGDVIPVDRISNLPESVIFHILSFLPTTSVFATNFLSKSWKLRWTKVASFDLDYRVWPDDNCYPCWLWPENRWGPKIFQRRVPNWKFEEFVHMVLLRQSGESSMDKFRLTWDYSRYNCFSLGLLITTAIARNVQVLELCRLSSKDLRIDYSEIYLPGALYTCRSLEVLKLSGPMILDPHVVCLPKLAVLELNSVVYESGGSFPDSPVLQWLLSGSPVLQSLTIERQHDDGMELVSISSPTLKRLQINFREDCDCILNNRKCMEDYLGTIYCKLEIDTPALEYLVLKDYASTVGFSIQELASVTEVDLDIPPDRDNHSELDSNSILELLQACYGVKILKLSLPTAMALRKTSKELPASLEGLSANFERLTKLVIQIECCEWCFLMDMMNCCGKLQVLDITKYVDSGCKCCHDHDVVGVKCWENPVSVPRCLSFNLKRVSYRGFEGLEGGEMSMLEYILNHALVMEIIDVSYTSHEPIDLKKKSQIRNKVSMFPRASPTCRVSFT